MCVRRVLVCEWGVVSVVEIIFFIIFPQCRGERSERWGVKASEASGGGM